MKIVNYLCPHGLNPGPYQDWSAGHKAEHSWLLDVLKNTFKATHVCMPTEAKSYFKNDFTPGKLAWMCEQIAGRNMTPIIWMDKWTWTLDNAHDWINETHQATHHTNPVWLLGSEMDLAWKDVGPFAYLNRVWQAKVQLLDMGVDIKNIWAGGSTGLSSDYINSAVCPGKIAWTVWAAILSALSQNISVFVEIAGQIDNLRPETRDKLIMIEAGWSAANGGDENQDNILRSCLYAAAKNKTPVGLWLPIDTVHETRETVEKKYGLLGVDDSGSIYERPALASWISL